MLEWASDMAGNLAGDNSLGESETRSQETCDVVHEQGKTGMPVDLMSYWFRTLVGTL